MAVLQTREDWKTLWCNCGWRRIQLFQSILRRLRKWSTFSTPDSNITVTTQNTILILMQNSKHIVASTVPRNLYVQITQACTSCFYCMYTSYILAYFTDKEVQRMCFCSLDQREKWKDQARKTGLLFRVLLWMSTKDKYLLSEWNCPINLHKCFCSWEKTVCVNQHRGPSITLK